MITHAALHFDTSVPDAMRELVRAVRHWDDVSDKTIEHMTSYPNLSKQYRLIQAVRALLTAEGYR